MDLNNGVLSFEKVDLAVKGTTTTYKNCVRLVKNSREKLPSMCIISMDLIRECGFNPGDRVDLLQSGTMFAFEKPSCGLLTLRAHGKISSTSLSVHLRAATRGCLFYDAIVDNGRIVFWAKKQDAEEAV